VTSDVIVLGVGATPFGRHLGSTVSDLVGQATREAMGDAGISRDTIGAIFYANVSQKALDRQHMIPGQVALRPHGFAGVPVVNVENACAGGATALWLAIAHIRAGLSDVALAVGVDKLVSADPHKSLEVFDGALDVARRDEALTALTELAAPLSPDLEVAAGERSVFMEVYAALARTHMERFGTTEAQLAAVSAKNHAHSVHNPRAQFRRPFTVDEVLAARRVAWPLTVPMCSPVSDGAATVVVTSAEFARTRASYRHAAKVLGSVLVSGTDRDPDDATNHIGRRAALTAYEQAGIDPGDVDVAEVHDATAFGEIQQVENLGFCPIGHGGPWSASGASSLGGILPVNPSGGLESRGHPVSATGLAQVFELVTQLRGQAGDRQVPDAQIAIAENGGGLYRYEEAIAAVTLFGRTK
jgi:acetyl-CoA acetyltransferase